MSEITVVGLGLMGAALADQLQRNDHAMTVWNRSPENIQRFIDNGANGESNVLNAISASPVVLICVGNYDDTLSIFNSESVTPTLKDRIVVQLSTGTPLDAQKGEDWFSSHGARYIDGAILGGPASLATDHAQIIFSGPEEAFYDARNVLSSLCQKTRYIDDNIRSAAALDLAWLCRHYGTFAGVTHGANLCESEGVSLDLYAQMFPESEYAQEFVNTMHNQDYENPTATLRTWGAALDVIRKQSSDSGIDEKFPNLVASLFEKAVKAGYGEEDVAALIKVLRNA